MAPGGNTVLQKTLFAGYKTVVDIRSSKNI